MLLELSVENVAILERANLAFGPGLNVLTGETGAGKSVLIDAVSVLLGARASEELIGRFGDRAVISAVFDLSRAPAAARVAAELGYADDGDAQLVLSREISRGGRNIARINGRPATVANVRDIARHLVDMHGQHEHQSLLEPAQHRALVDAFGGDELLRLRQRVEEAYRRVARLRAELAGLAGDARERARTLDLYRFQIDEIEAARLRPDEEEELLAARRRMANAERIREALVRAYAAAYETSGGAESAFDRTGEALAALQRAAAYDQRLFTVVQLLEAASAHLEEAGRALRAHLDEVDIDPAEAEAVERRITLINELKRKYGDTIEEVLAYRDRLRAELARLEGAEEHAAALEAELAEALADLGQGVEALSAARRAAAERLAQAVQKELADLAMVARVIVEVRQEEAADGVPCGDRRLRVGPEGADRVEILVSANPGEEPRPLHRVASGGELSRFMLALKTVSGRRDGVATLIFDEIDAGIGGRTATAVADKLLAVAAEHQVLCVTHLPQIAAVADHHFVIEKEIRSGRTVASVRAVDGEAREREIARMLAGAEESVDLEHARALLLRRSRRSG